MAANGLQADYQRVLETSRSQGDLLEEPAGKERRSHPRLKVNPGKLPVELDPWVFAIDVSISGMAFYADEAAEPGKTVTISLGPQHSASAEVVGCRQDPDGRYRLHCRFADEAAGMALLVAIKDLEQQGAG